MKTMKNSVDQAIERSELSWIARRKATQIKYTAIRRVLQQLFAPLLMVQEEVE